MVEDDTKPDHSRIDDQYENKADDGIEIIKQAGQRAKYIQMVINNAKNNKDIRAHLEKSKFEIPTRIPPEMIDVTDAQTNHSFFYGPQ
eukprot:9944142-Heterocapsa_arctica.AAC.1